MRICYTVQRTIGEPLTGSENYIYDLARKLSEHDEVTILATQRRQSQPAATTEVGLARVLAFPVRDSRWMGLGIRYLMRKDASGISRRVLAYPADGFLHSWSHGYWSPGMYEWLLAADLDVLHCQALPLSTSWIGWRASRGKRFPFVITPALHLADPNYDPPYISRILRDADGIIAQTDTERRYLIRLGIPAEDTWVIPPGVDVESWSHPPAGRFRAANGIAENQFVVLIPRKQEEKGTFHTLAALELLAREGVHPSCVLLGTCPWPIQFRVRRWITKLASLGTRVIDTGFLPRSAFRDCLAASDVVVEPSMADSFGMVYQDSWMAGKPVIAADCGGIPDVVRNGENGLLVPFGSIESIAESIRVLMSDPGHARRLGEAGNATTLARYDLTKIADQIRQVYEVVIGRRERHR